MDVLQVIIRDDIDGERAGREEGLHILVQGCMDPGVSPKVVHMVQIPFQAVFPDADVQDTVHHLILEKEGVCVVVVLQFLDQSPYSLQSDFGLFQGAVGEEVFQKFHGIGFFFLYHSAGIIQEQSLNGLTWKHLLHTGECCGCSRLIDSHSMLHPF